MTYIANLTRPEGDPKILQTGPSSLTASDKMARALGWFSIGLGLTELFALAPSRARSAWRERSAWSAFTVRAKSGPG
jgi:hypothetical protein